MNIELINQGKQMVFCESTYKRMKYKSDRYHLIIDTVYYFKEIKVY